MTEFFAKDEGLLLGSDVTKGLSSLMSKLKNVDGEKVLWFEAGTYFLVAENCEKKKLHITNTIGDSEWLKGEDPHVLNVGIFLSGIKNLKIIGTDTVFCVQGQMTNLVLEDCENIFVEGISFCAENPPLHEFAVKNVRPFYVDFELDSESRYQKISKIEKKQQHAWGRFEFVGRDFQEGFFKNRMTAHWIGRTDAENTDNIKRVGHPFRFAAGIKETGQNAFRAYYLSTRRFHAGERFCVFEARRKNVGIFASRCKNISLKNVKQHFNFSLAFVTQDCENISLEKLTFAPKNGSAKLMTSLADFMQICMCRGDVKIIDSRFEGAGDDCLNVHGIHFKITEIDDKTIKVKFCHPQTHGFNPLRIGDEVEFVDPTTLLAKGKAKILSSKLINEYEIQLVLDNVRGCKTGHVIEDVSSCPNLLFQGNTINRIITRGLLVTTRGKVVVRDNLFKSTSMHSILFSDDAKSWFESGQVKDVEISKNTFQRCPMRNIVIKPENRKHAGAVHSGFVIEDNTFNSCPGGGIYIKSSDKIAIKNNRISKKSKDFLKTQNVSNFESDL